jgi:hypothetical protein
MTRAKSPVQALAAGAAGISVSPALTDIVKIFDRNY